MNGHINCNTPFSDGKSYSIKNCLRIQVPANEKGAVEHEMVK